MKISVTTVAAAIAFLSIAGCTNQQLKPIDLPSVSAVQQEIKRQVGIYMIESKTPLSVNINGTMVPVPQLSSNDFACGRGNIAFDLNKVKAELVTELDTTKSV